MENMEKRWLYDDTVKSPWGFDKNRNGKGQDRHDARRWLERSYDYKEANQLIINFHDQRRKLDRISTSSKDTNEKRALQKQARMLDDIAITSYKALLNDHMKVILKYDYLAEDLIEMTVYPKLIEQRKSRLENIIWPQKMHFL